MEYNTFENVFEFQKKSKIKASLGLKNNEGKYPFYTSSKNLTKTIDEFLFKEKSLIFGTGGSASIHCSTDKFAVSTDCFVCQVKNKKNVFIKYVYYYFLGNIYLLENGFKGAGLKHISKRYISDLKIPLPNLATQKKIAAILDEADKLRQLNQQVVNKYQKLTQSLFLEMFGDTWLNPKKWEVKLVEELALDEKYSIKAGPFGSSLKKEFYVKHGYKIYGQEQVIKNDLTFGNYYIDENRYQTLKNCKVKTGDILISLVGTYGKIAIIPEKFEKGIINPRLMKLTPNQDIIRPDFLKVLLQSKGVLLQTKLQSRGGTMDIVNVGIMRKIKVPIPPLKLQNQFAAHIKEIETQKEQATQSLQQSEQLFDSLLQKAFKGGLV